MQYDIQFLNTEQEGLVPFSFTGKCTGSRVIAQKVLVLIFTDPESRGYGGGLDPKALFTSTDPISIIRGAVVDISFILEEQYPGIIIEIQNVHRDRGSLSLEIRIETEGIEDLVNATIPIEV